MEDYREDKLDRRRNIRKSIDSLQDKLKSTRNAFQMQSLADEISKLEQERIETENLFTEEDVAEEDAPSELFPILADIWSRYPEPTKKLTYLDREILSVYLYMHYFGEEFLGMMTSRKIRLDVKYSVERDSFYDLYHQVQRSVDNYQTEAGRIADGTYSKEYEADLLRRKVEMRHALLVEVDWFFRKIRRFSGELLDDIEGEGVFCQNPTEPLEYSRLDRETVLRGKSVEDAIATLNELSEEIVEYLGIPDFQQRPL